MVPALGAAVRDRAGLITAPTTRDALLVAFFGGALADAHAAFG